MPMKKKMKVIHSFYGIIVGNMIKIQNHSFIVCIDYMKRIIDFKLPFLAKVFIRFQLYLMKLKVVLKKELFIMGIAVSLKNMHNGFGKPIFFL